jgi:putative hemolysin
MVAGVTETRTVDNRHLAVMIVTAVIMASHVEGAIAQPPTDKMAQLSPQQPCEPLIDGTYCATQGGRLSRTTPSQVGMAPIQSLGGDLSLGQTQPGTLGGITFNGGGTICIGFLRRGACN